MDFWQGGKKGARPNARLVVTVNVLASDDEFL